MATNLRSGLTNDGLKRPSNDGLKRPSNDGLKRPSNDGLKRPSNDGLNIIFAAQADSYFPGLITAPFLLLFGLALMVRIVHPVNRMPVQ